MELLILHRLGGFTAGKLKKQEHDGDKLSRFTFAHMSCFANFGPSTGPYVIQLLLMLSSHGFAMRLQFDIFKIVFFR